MNYVDTAIPSSGSANALSNPSQAPSAAEAGSRVNSTDRSATNGQIARGNMVADTSHKMNFLMAF